MFILELCHGLGMDGFAGQIQPTGQQLIITVKDVCTRVWFKKQLGFIYMN